MGNTVRMDAIIVTEPNLQKTGVPVNVADEPHLAIVKGCGAVIEDLEKYKHVLL